MFTLFSEPLSFCTYFFLALAILSLWVTKRSRPPVWISLLGIAVVTGLLARRINLLGVASGAVLGGCCYAFYCLKFDKYIKTALAVALAVCSLALKFHKMPGFYNWQIVSNIILSPNAAPFNFYLNFDIPHYRPLFSGTGTSQHRSDGFRVALGLERCNSSHFSGLGCFVRVIVFGGVRRICT